MNRTRTDLRLRKWQPVEEKDKSKKDQAVDEDVESDLKSSSIFSLFLQVVVVVVGCCYGRRCTNGPLSTRGINARWINKQDKTRWIGMKKKTSSDATAIAPMAPISLLAPISGILLSDGRPITNWTFLSYHSSMISSLSFSLRVSLCPSLSLRVSFSLSESLSSWLACTDGDSDGHAPFYQRHWPSFFLSFVRFFLPFASNPTAALATLQS